MSGFIKLRRGLKGHWITQDTHTLSVFMHILLGASFADQKVMSHGELVELKRGQIRTSVRQISEATGVDRGCVDRRLKLLERERVIETVKSHRYTLITLLKYDIGEDECDSDVPQDQPHHQPQDQPQDQPPYKKTIKKTKKTIKKDIPKKVFGHFQNVHLSEAEEHKYRNEYGEQFFQRLVEKLDSWIEADKTPKRIKNGKNAAACFRSWVLNAVAKEQLEAQRAQPKQSRQQEISNNLKQKILKRGDHGSQESGGGSVSLPSELL